jgi:uncharacterized membrane protein YidH (DUF202 family)
VTAIATGIGVGRIVPSLTNQTRWPYEIVGAAFAFVGVLAMVYGMVRERSVRESLRRGKFVPPHDEMLIALSVVGGLLGLVVVVLVLTD